MYPRCRRALGLLSGAVIALIPAFAPTRALAWGALGHQLIAEVGSELSPEGNAFWSANTKTLGVLTNVPDRNWKRGGSAKREKPTHFFQIDSFFSDASQYGLFPQLFKAAVAKFGDDVIEENGTAPWRADQFYVLAVEALRNKDYRGGVDMAGVMSHYVGDISQPLHVSKNYDGADTGDKGIHAYFETKILATQDEDELRDEVRTRAQALMKDARFVKGVTNGGFLQSVFTEVNRSIGYAERIIDIDLRLGRDSEGRAELLEIAKDRMADGAAMYALLLGKAWREANLPDINKHLSADVPEWVKPDYEDLDSMTNIVKKKKREERENQLTIRDCD